MERLLEARTAVEDVAGEGPIAFAELHDSLTRLPHISDADAVQLAQAVLREYWHAGRLTIHRGRAVDDELPQVSGAEAARMIEDASAYRYGDGDELRAWFSASP